MTDQSRVIYNLSSRVLSLAQVIDMLPAGAYTIRLEKPDLPALSWRAEIARVETIRDMDLPRREVRGE